MDQWTVHVEPSLCNSTGICAGVAPDRFGIGPDRRSRPLVTVVEAGDDAVMDAAACCPTEAIVLTDRRTGDRVPPDL
jgi:ferredoxin